MSVTFYIQLANLPLEDFPEHELQISNGTAEALLALMGIDPRPDDGEDLTGFVSLETWYGGVHLLLDTINQKVIEGDPCEDLARYTARFAVLGWEAKNMVALWRQKTVIGWA